MVQKITFANRAKMAMRNIVLYLEDNASTATAERFVDKVYETADKIWMHPEIGRPSPIDKNVRFIQIDNKRLMFYEFDGNELSIVDIFDMRQDPKKRKY
jgi:plasmid stabilization system protein ParE